ncbi:DUF1697 domain-containing protein [Xanthomarina sp.]|uniref:DUF1697 domain-containing protein n=1 Tax=Xanthomarina sp. TaxID=1931211 RepID=UPI002CFE92BE|nr:DUF1697 domain-containing protein [Xanthomarina sp.]HLV38647.1 DUF1697 domain-containing protein [Xanthomarina sp.]
MSICIVLIKGINVGGHKKVPMAELRELLIKSGFENVQTYIQSGNVILDSSEKGNSIEIKIQKAIMTHFGFEVSVLVKTRQDLKRIFDACPFSDEEKRSSYFMLLHDAPDDDLIKLASKKTYEGEEYKIINDCIYFFSEKGFGQAKFNASFFERKLKTFATARNYNTMVKLIAMSLINEKDL